MKNSKTKLLFTDVVAMWLIEIEKRVSPITFDGYKRMSNNYVVPYYIKEENNFYVDEITYEHVQKFVVYYMEEIEKEKYYVPITKYVNDDRDKIKVII